MTELPKMQSLPCCILNEKPCTKQGQSGELKGVIALGFYKDHCAETIISLLFIKAASHFFFLNPVSSLLPIPHIYHPPHPPPGASFPVLGIQISPVQNQSLFHRACFINSECAGQHLCIPRYLDKEPGNNLLEIRRVLSGQYSGQLHKNVHTLFLDHCHLYYSLTCGPNSPMQMPDAS